MHSAAVDRANCGNALQAQEEQERRDNNKEDTAWHTKGYSTDGGGGHWKELHSHMQFCLQQLGKHTGME
jgi:hypothetical protein